MLYKGDNLEAVWTNDTTEMLFKVKLMFQQFPMFTLLVHLRLILAE